MARRHPRAAPSQQCPPLQHPPLRHTHLQHEHCAGTGPRAPRGRQPAVQLQGCQEQRRLDAACAGRANGRSGAGVESSCITLLWKVCLLPSETLSPPLGPTSAPPSSVLPGPSHPAAARQQPPAAAAPASSEESRSRVAAEGSSNSTASTRASASEATAAPPGPPGPPGPPSSTASRQYSAGALVFSAARGVELMIAARSALTRRGSGGGQPGARGRAVAPTLCLTRPGDCPGCLHALVARAAAPPAQPCPAALPPTLRC